MKLSFQNADFKEETVLRLANPFFKRLPAQRFHKFIRVFIRLHMNDFAGQSCLPQDTDTSQRRLTPGTVAVIGQQHVIRIPPQKSRLLRRKSGPQ